ncbi:DUF3450 family protein [Pseudomarimonas arenosa]|uniref:DUF3450 family protein n=1 Tax=Pseudomarimonas arenosa TaxID=2774145 RepID=A0AAW3ZQ24_9GAMM|nr:DUF3450 family protein [Pseudomarimonas arenosa]MBD8527035.1 DUF3450 family protein [Pseudomarimonas arenosa]
MSNPSYLSRNAVRALPIALLVACGPLLAAPNDAGLAERLIALRGEVEQLNSELELQRDEQRAVLSGLAAQKAELNASVDRQKLAARDAETKLLAAQEAATQAGASGDALQPVLLQAIDGLQQQIRAGLPFKIDERSADLDALRTDLQNGSLLAARGANRLWAFFEDEFRLTRENALHNQTIEVEGERVLAEVAKIGAMALYFRTPDGRYGQAVRSAERWQFVLATEAEHNARIAQLFDALRKQIRQGYFELPVLAAAGGK